MTLLPVNEVMQAWYKMCEKAKSLEQLEDLTILLGSAKEFLIEKDGQQFYIMEQVKALIPLNSQ